MSLLPAGRLYSPTVRTGDFSIYFRSLGGEKHLQREMRGMWVLWWCTAAGSRDQPASAVALEAGPASEL